MGLYDRPYYGGGQDAGGGSPMGGMHIGMPKPGQAVKWLLLVNVGVFVIQLLSAGQMTGLFGATADGWWQLWRYLTFQFLHGGVWHLALNMLGLYFLGTAVEARFGTKRFLQLYFSCGVMAGVAYVIISKVVSAQGWIPLVGASGGVYGLIVTAAVFFPHFRIIFLFFPVPIRLAAVIIFGVMILTLLGGAGQAIRQPGTELSGEFWSQVAHFGGAVTAGAWVFTGLLSKPGQASGGPGPAESIKSKLQKGAWERRIKQRQQHQQEIDRILAKIHQEGLDSLSRSEKRLLSEATKAQRDEDKRIRKL